MAGESTRVIFIPVDQSKNAEHAFEWFLKTCYRGGTDKVVFFHLYEAPSLGIFDFQEGFHLAADKFQKEMAVVRAGVEKLKDQYVFRSQALKIHHEFLDEAGNNPGERIVQKAEEKNASLIIMGTRGMGKVRRTFLGSVSDFVLHHAKKPVCVVPPESEEQKNQ